MDESVLFIVCVNQFEFKALFVKMRQNAHFETFKNGNKILVTK